MKESARLASRPTWLPAVVLVVAASAVVAFAATGVRLILPGARLPGAWGPLVRLAGVAAAAAGLWGLLVQRRRLMQPGRHAPDPAAAGLTAAGVTMVVLAALAMLAPRQHVVVPTAPDTGELSSPQSPPPETPPPGASGSHKSGFPGGFGLGLLRGRRLRTGPGVAGSQSQTPEPPAWEVLRRARWIVVALLLLAALAIALRQFTRRGTDEELEEEPPEPEPPVAAEDAAAGLAASLDELAAPGRDPRGQITAAYRRLLGALAQAGAPRLPQEAPYEHLDRTLGPLRLQPEPMRRLTELYVVAQFSEHPVTEAHRAAAAEALEASLSGLRPSTDDRRPTIGSRGTHGSGS